MKKKRLRIEKENEGLSVVPFLVIYEDQNFVKFKIKVQIYYVKVQIEK